jgi:hypothetical protein
MFKFDSPIVFQSAPAWQQDEDIIVGIMIRQLLSFEGGILDNKTIGAMESIIEEAARMAENIGARAHYVRSIGARLMLNGKPMDEWKNTLNNTCPHCGNHTYAGRFGY